MMKNATLKTQKSKIYKDMKLCFTIKKALSLSLFLSLFFTFEISSLIFNLPVYATMPASTNYQLQEYTFGAGGTKNSTSANYGLNGVLGEIEFGKPSSANYAFTAGLTYMMQADVPPAPTLTNPSSNYDRLKLVMNKGSNEPDATYAVAISTDNFVSDTQYVKSDNTVGGTLTAADFRSYTSWGDTSGSYITGLAPNVTYYVKAKAKQGSFTESPWGAASSGVTTSQSTLTFAVSSSSITFENLNSGNAYTDSTKTTTLTTSTNAYNGYLVNGRETGVLTASVGTIADYTSPNSAPTTWTGTGFGYTTNDSDLTGGTADRFTSGGAKYAGFTTASPGDPVADHAGPVLSPITSEPFTISYRVTAASTQKAGQYQTTVLYIVVPSY